MKDTPTAHFGHSPYLSSRIVNFIHDLSQKLGREPDDFLFIEPYSIGDAVQSLGLLPAFRRAYCRDGQRILFLCQERALPLTTVMPYADVAYAAPLAQHELAFEYMASLATVLTPQLPVVCAPDMHAFGRIARAAVSPLAAKRSIFHLRQDDPFAPPVIGDALRRDVEARLDGSGLTRGRALLLFPHALSVDDPGHAFWPILVERLREALPRVSVYTDVTTGIEAVPGTGGITLSVPEIVPAIEYAGAAVLLRSGLVDLAAHAEADIFSVVPPKTHYKFVPAATAPEDLFVSRVFPGTRVTDLLLPDVSAQAAAAVAERIVTRLAQAAQAR